MTDGTWENRIVGHGVEDPGSLLANPFNFRRHPKEQQDALEGALNTIGWIQRVIVNRTTGHLIDGHLRVELAMRKDSNPIPVTYVELSEAEEKLALATIDPIAGLAATDDELLQSLLDGVSADDEKLDEFLDSMRNDNDPTGGNTDEDDIPEPTLEPVTKPGDIWILGEHRLICGDSTKEGHMSALMDGEAADMVWTDPPYNVDYEGGTGEKTKIENDKMEDSAFRRFLLDSMRAMVRHTRDGGCAYVAHADSEGRNFRAAFEDGGWMLKQCLIWAKSSATLSRQDYNWQHEPILYGWKPGAAHYFAGDFTLTTIIDGEEDPEDMTRDKLLQIAQAVRQYSTILREDKPRENELHPTMKPVGLVRRCINASTKHGEIVLDGFGGSGTTLIACETIGRKARLVEFDPIFCDVIIKRWQEFTGGDARRKDDGEAFCDIEGQAA